MVQQIPLSENSKVYDYRKKLVGSFHIDLLPCDRQGIAYDNIEKIVVHEPEKQLKRLYFIIRMSNFKCVAGRYKKIYAQFKLYGQEGYTKTEVGETSFVDFQTVISYDSVDAELIKHYTSYPMFVQVYGVQLVTTNEVKKSMTTKEWFEHERKDKHVMTDESMREEITKLNRELERTRSKLVGFEIALIKYLC
jgi:hypothetical protein